MCVSIIVQNCHTQYSNEQCSDNYPPDNHRSSDEVYWRQTTTDENSKCTMHLFYSQPSTLTPTPPWGRMFRRPCRTALLLSVSCAVYVSLFLGRWCCPWWCRWFCSDSTLAMRHSLASQATSWADCRPSLTLLHDLSCHGVGTTTSQYFSRSCTGWESSSGSSSSSQYSSSAAWTAWLRRTYPVIYNVCQTWWLVDVCARRQRRRSSSRRHAFPPATALSPWLRCGHGTACRHLSYRCLCWRPSGVSWRRNCLPEAFLISAALPMTASDWHSVHTLRRTRVLSLF